MAEGGAGALFFSRTYDYLANYLPRQVGKSPETVRAYRDALTVFRRYALESLGKGVGRLTFGDVDRDCVLGWLESMAGEGLSAATRNQRLSAIRSYLWYAADCDVAITSVALSVAGIPRVSGPERVKERLSEGALRAILSAPDQRTRIGCRDTALMSVLYDTGIRLSELTGLTVGDIHLDDEQPHVYVVGKGDKERPVGITDPTVEQVRRHLKMSHADGPKTSDPLFYTRHGGAKCRMSPSNVERLVQRYADMARPSCPEVPERVCPHMFRRSRATDLYQQGVELAMVSRILGHAKLETTKVYAVPSMEQMREAMSGVCRTEEPEEPTWLEDEDMMARLCGLR